MPQGSTAALTTGRAVQWKACLRIEVVDDQTVVALDGDDCEVLAGRHAPLLAPLLAQGRSVEQLYDDLDGVVTPPEIDYVLDHLDAKGLLAEATSAPANVAAFWHGLGIHPEHAQGALARRPVDVTGPDDFGAREVREALRAAGVAHADGAEMRVIVVRDHLDPALAGVNAEALATGRPWMLLNLRGREPQVGPIFRPGATGCWACLAQRVASNRQIETFLARAGASGDGVDRTPLHPAALGVAAAVAAQEILKGVVVGAPHDLTGAILAIDVQTMATTRHALVRRPQCEACGSGALPTLDAACYALAPAEGRTHAPTGSRLVSPEATYDRLKHHVSRFTGVVRTLEPVGEGSGNGLTYSYTAGHNFALMQHDLRFALLNLRGRSGGKGSRGVDARVGAICEAIERYSGVWRGDEPSIVRARIGEFAGRALRPNELMLFSDAQFADRDAWNRAHSAGFHRVPERFRDDDAVDWAPAFSLTRQAFVHVPAAYCYFGHQDLQNYFFSTCDSNGNAAGNSKEEAILQGLLELIERDAVALWWHNRVRRPEVTLDSLADPYVERLREHYRGLGRELWLLDVTSDLGVPVVAAVSRALGRDCEDVIVGFGAHPDPVVAATRAIAELNQFLPAVARRGPDGRTIYWFPEPEAVRWWRTATVENRPFIAPDPAQTRRRIQDLGSGGPASVGDALAAVMARVEALGFEILVLDQSQPDVELSVVKVMVPGLRHFWKRFGPGRLYDAPVRLGWLDRPLLEHELNPDGVFF